MKETEGISAGAAGSSRPSPEVQHIFMYQEGFMDISQIAGATAAMSSSQVQGAGGGHHHHHHKSISDQVSSMQTAITNAVKAGTLTTDQATALQNELNDVTQTLTAAQTAASSQTATTGAASTATSANPLSQLSDDDKKKIFSELQDVRSQLQAANGVTSGTPAGGTTPTATSTQINQLFNAIDTDGNGSISESEFSAFLNNVAQSGGYDQSAAPTSSATAAAGSTMSLLA
jgi:hypothetical protein